MLLHKLHGHMSRHTSAGVASGSDSKKSRAHSIMPALIVSGLQGTPLTGGSLTFVRFMFLTLSVHQRGSKGSYSAPADSSFTTDVIFNSRIIVFVF